MRSSLLGVLTCILLGCANSSPDRASLEPNLPEPEPDGVRFYHGSWFAPDSIYAFQITDEYIAVADSSADAVKNMEISSSDCLELIDAYHDLLAAIFQTSDIASGEIQVPEPDEIVMDGPDYRVELWSRSASTTLVLKGGGNSQLVSPWVDAALKVRRVAEACGDG